MSYSRRQADRVDRMLESVRSRIRAVESDIVSERIAFESLYERKKQLHDQLLTQLTELLEEEQRRLETDVQR